jgi:serine/threonine protein kinase
MASRLKGCDVNRLRLSLENRLSEAEEAELEGHLESCVSCRKELEQLAAVSELWGEAQSLRDDERPAGSVTTGGHVAAIPSSRFDDDDQDDEPDGGWLEFLDPPGPDRPHALGRLGPYEILEFVGRGGMGLVLKARDPALDRMVAIKVLTPALAHGATARRRFSREAKAVAAVGHEHIVAVHAVDEFRGLPYLVMQYVPGRSLQDRLDASGPLEIKEILRIGMQAARALAAAHAQGVVHRDIKPANILLENCIERVKLTDFGLARAIDDATLTQSGVIAGTPQYMAPEQARGEPVAAAADLFALGAVLYAMATGRPPFRAESALAVLKRVCEVPHRSVRELNPDVPAWLEAIIDRLLAKEPADRVQTATEVADLLERGLAHLQQPATVPPPAVLLTDPQCSQPVDFDATATKPSSVSRRRFRLAAAIVLLVGAGFGASEAAGLTQVSDFVATVLRIKTSEGTLVIKCADPSVKVQLDGQDIVIAGSGLQEIRLRTGTHRLAVLKDGRPIRENLVTVARGDKEVVNVSLEATEPARLAADKSFWDMLAPASHANQCLACHRNFQTMRLDAPLPEGHPPVEFDYRLSVDPNLTALRGHPPDAIRGMAAGMTPHPVHGRGLVWSLAYAPNGRELVIGQQGIDGRVAALRVWDLYKHREIASFQRPTPIGYRAVAFSPDGRSLAAGTFDGYLTVMATDRWVLKREINNVSAINALACLPKSDIVAVGDWDGNVKFYHPTSKIEALIEYPGRIFAITISPDGSTLAVGGEAKIIQLYDIATFRRKATFHGHTQAIESLDFSPDGKLLASAGGSVVRIWDVPSGTTVGEHIHRSQQVLCVRFSPDGKLLAIAGGEGGLAHDKVLDTEVVIYAIPRRNVVQRMQGHKNSIRALAFAPDGDTIASGSMDQTVKIWDCETGKLQETIVPGEDPNMPAPPAAVP